MSCQFDKKYLLQYSDGDMSTAEIKKIKKHIDGCPECCSFLKDIERTKKTIKLGYQNMPRPNCPDEDAVNQYHSGQMSKDEEQLYEKHFNVCLYCQVEQRHFKYKLTDEMKKEVTLPLSQEKIAEIKKKIFNRGASAEVTKSCFDEYLVTIEPIGNRMRLIYTDLVNFVASESLEFGDFDQHQQIFEETFRIWWGNFGAKKPKQFLRAAFNEQDDMKKPPLFNFCYVMTSLFLLLPETIKDILLGKKKSGELITHLANEIDAEEKEALRLFAENKYKIKRVFSFIKAKAHEWVEFTEEQS